MPMATPEIYPHHSIGRDVAAIAIGEWERGVEDPPGHGCERIDGYIRGAQGLGWPSANVGPDRDDGTVVYDEDGDFNWCGAFAAWCWGAVGLLLTHRYYAWSSTGRLWQWSRDGGRPSPRKGSPVGDSRRRIRPLDILAGDAVILGPAGAKAGNHIEVAVSSCTAGIVDTIGGNATGRGPVVGQRYEGVTAHARRVTVNSADGWRILYGVRPLITDIEPK